MNHKPFVLSDAERAYRLLDGELWAAPLPTAGEIPEDAWVVVDLNDFEGAQRDFLRNLVSTLIAVEVRDAGETPAAAPSAKALAHELRKLAPGHVEYQVANPVDGGFCMAFDRSNARDPKHKAHQWLKEHREHHPGSRFAGYEVKRVVVFSPLEHAALRAADLLDARESESVDQLQDRGQFFVRDVDENGTVPIDNFLFIETNENVGWQDRIKDTPNEIKLESTASCVYVTWRKHGQPSKNEMFSTKAQALRRLADVLDGSVSFDDFAKDNEKDSEGVE